MTNNDTSLNESDLRQIDEAAMPLEEGQTEEPQELAKATDTVRRPVVYYPAKILTQKCRPIDNPTDPYIAQLIEDLKETMIVGGGLGISAPQIGDKLRVFITRLDPSKSDDSMDQEIKVYINPTVTLLGKNKEKSEGCLSFPSILIKTQRSTRIRVTATDINCIRFTTELSGLDAHVVQHENNHLDGITLFDRMNETQKIKCRKSLKLLNQLSAYHAHMAEKAKTKDSEDVVVIGNDGPNSAVKVAAEVNKVIDLVDLY